MKQQKIYSIIIGLVAYIIISHIFHVFFRGKTDIALSLLYIYNDMLYIVGYIFTWGCKLNCVTRSKLDFD